MKRLPTLFLVFVFALTASAAVETYTIDPVHSSVGFSIRHFVSKVPGRFTKFDGTITVDRDNLENSSVEATIDVNSVNTASAKRDAMLMDAGFFATDKFPTMTFKSTSWKKTGENTFDVTGNLTIKGVTKQTALKVTLLGFGPGMKGAKLSGWEATTTLNRNDFGVSSFPKILGDDVAVDITVEADLKK